MRLVSTALTALLLLAVACGGGDKAEPREALSGLQTQVAASATIAPSPAGPSASAAARSPSDPTPAPQHSKDWAIDQVRDAPGSSMWCAATFWTDGRLATCPVRVIVNAYCAGSEHWPYQATALAELESSQAASGRWYGEYVSAGEFWEIGFVCRAPSDFFDPLPERVVSGAVDTEVTSADWLAGMVAQVHEDSGEIFPRGLQRGFLE